MKVVTSAAIALALLASPAVAKCVPMNVVKAATVKAHGKLIALTHDQFEFLRGVYVMNPQTPPGLPPGDGASVTRFEGDGGAIFFTVGNKTACASMPVPKELMEMVDKVGGGEVEKPSEEDQGDPS